MSNSLYRTVHIARISAALHQCAVLEGLEHDAERGRIREVLVRGLFRPLLPSHIGVGTGFVVARDGRQSSQQDVVIYDPSRLAPALFDSEIGIFPVESVFYCIEIKSTLRYPDLRQAHESASTIRSMVPTKNLPYFGILALRTDLTADAEGKELERYRKFVGTRPALLSNICIPDVEYFWLTRFGAQSWHERGTEVLAFLGHIANGVHEHFDELRASMPSAGTYIIAADQEINPLLQRMVDITKTDPAEAKRNAKALAKELDDTIEALTVILARFRSGSTTVIKPNELLSVARTMRESFASLYES